MIAIAMVMPASALNMQKGLKADPDAQEEAVFGDDPQGPSPLLLGGIVAAIIVVIFCVFRAVRNRGDGYRAFGDKSGLSTSSSDITSSETGSTDRELKSRMERFEKRLDDHKKMLETRDPEAGSSSITDSESKLSSSVGGGKPMWITRRCLKPATRRLGAHPSRT